jgi:hypothetical protein
MSRHRGRGRHGNGPKTASAGDGATAAPVEGAPAEGALPGGGPQKAPRERSGKPREPAKQREQSGKPRAQRSGQRHERTGEAAKGGARSSEQRAASARPSPSRRQSAATSRAAPGTELPEGTEAAEPCQPRKVCTLAQMRRFIKSRPYVPLHELRRRFEIAGDEDEVTPIAADGGTLFVGLPAMEAGFLSDLIKNGEVGYELLLDPVSPALVGIFPMRPVARQ